MLTTLEKKRKLGCKTTILHRARCRQYWGLIALWSLIYFYPKPRNETRDKIGFHAICVSVLKPVRKIVFKFLLIKEWNRRSSIECDTSEVWFSLRPDFYQSNQVTRYSISHGRWQLFSRSIHFSHGHHRPVFIHTFLSQWCANGKRSFVQITNRSSGRRDEEIRNEQTFPTILNTMGGKISPFVLEMVIKPSHGLLFSHVY